MGDRANIHCYDGDKNTGVFLYTHWKGLDACKIAVAKSLARARDRWNDDQYMNRVIFQELIGDDNGITGFGITSDVRDGEDRVMEVNYMLKEVTTDEGTFGFSEFIENLSL